METGIVPISASNEARDVDEHRLLPRRYAVEKEDRVPLNTVAPRDLLSKPARPHGTVRTIQLDTGGDAQMWRQPQKLQPLKSPAPALARHTGINGEVLYYRRGTLPSWPLPTPRASLHTSHRHQEG